MAEVKLSSFYDETKEYSHSRADLLKFCLIPFMFFLVLGFPGRYGGYISQYCNFVFQTYFILFGFFTLVPDKEKRLKKLKTELKSSFKLFAIMFITFVALSVAYLALTGSLSSLASESFLRKRTFFNFLVLNVWPLPIGNSIWFIQSLVYAYIFFLIADKLKLSKLYLPILILLIAFMLATGELSGFCGFPHLGYPYFPGGAVTRAIPYMLIGMYLRKNIDKIGKIKSYIYLILFPIGLALAIGEIELLGYLGKLVYVGHTVGFGVMALSLCCIALSKTSKENSFFSYRGSIYSRRMYALCQPVSFIVWLICFLINPIYTIVTRNIDSLISLAICLFIVLFLDFVSYDKTVNGGVSLRKSLKELKSRLKNYKEYRKDASEENKAYRNMHRGDFRKNIKYAKEYRKEVAEENRAYKNRHRGEWRKNIKYANEYRKEVAEEKKARKNRKRRELRRRLRYQRKHFKHQIQRMLGLRDD